MMEQPNMAGLKGESITIPYVFFTRIRTSLALFITRITYGFLNGRAVVSFVLSDLNMPSSGMRTTRSLSLFARLNSIIKNPPAWMIISRLSQHMTA